MESNNNEPSNNIDSIDYKILEMCKWGGLLAATKICKDAKGLSFIDAKKYVEKLAIENNIEIKKVGISGKKLMIIFGIVWIIIIIIYNLTTTSTKIVSSRNNDTTNSSKKQESERQVKEELPPLETCTSAIGKIKTNGNGSIGSKTEFTELAKLLKNKDCDILEVVFVQKSPPDRNYDDMDLKVNYNRTTSVLQSIFTKTNVIEEFTNVNEECLKAFLKSGSQSFNSITDFCKDSKYDFNNREMKETAIGTKPEQRAFDGSVKIIEDYIKSNAKDASSIDFLEWSKVSAMGKNWVVRCKYKGTNSFGAIVTENSWFYIQDNKVVDTKNIQ